MVIDQMHFDLILYSLSVWWMGKKIKSLWWMKFMFICKKTKKRRWYKFLMIKYPHLYLYLYLEMSRLRPVDGYKHSPPCDFCYSQFLLLRSSPIHLPSPHISCLVIFMKKKNKNTTIFFFLISFRGHIKLLVCIFQVHVLFLDTRAI